MKHLLCPLALALALVACDGSPEPTTQPLMAAEAIAPDLMSDQPLWRADRLAAADPGGFGRSLAMVRARAVQNRDLPAPASSEARARMQAVEDAWIAGLSDDAYADTLRPVTTIEGVEYVGARPDLAVVARLRAGLAVGPRSGAAKDVSAARAPGSPIEQAYVIGTDTRRYSDEIAGVREYSVEKLWCAMASEPFQTANYWWCGSGATFSRNTIVTAAHVVYGCSNAGASGNFGARRAQIVEVCSAHGGGHACYRSWNNAYLGANLSTYVPLGWTQCGGWFYDYAMVRVVPGTYWIGGSGVNIPDFGTQTGWQGWTKPPIALVNGPGTPVVAIGYPGDAPGQQQATDGATGENNGGSWIAMGQGWQARGTVDITNGYSGGPLLFAADGYGHSGGWWRGAINSNQAISCTWPFPCNYTNYWRLFDDTTVNWFFNGATW